jgi:hypothetical protein
MDFENDSVVEPKIRKFLSVDNLDKKDIIIDIEAVADKKNSAVIEKNTKKDSNEEIDHGGVKKDSKEEAKHKPNEGLLKTSIINKRPKEALTQTISKNSKEDLGPITTDRMYRTRPMHIPIPISLMQDKNTPETPNLVLNRSLNPMIDELYEKTVTLARSAGRRAEIYKLIYVVIKIATTISGVIIGVLQVADFSSQLGARYTSMALGFFISLMQSLLALFPVDRRGILLKKDANKLKKISRHILVLKSLNMPTMEKLKKMEDFYAEVDDIDLDIYTFIGTQDYSLRPPEL